MKTSITLVIIFVLILLSTIMKSIEISRATLNKEPLTLDIYLESNGTITGTDKITTNGNIYTFTDNIDKTIIILKSNITIDGNALTLQGKGNGQSSGIKILNQTCITIKNLNMDNFEKAISCSNSENNTFKNNFISNCQIGIELIGSQNNLVTFNAFKNNTNDIAINYCSGDPQTVTQNNIGNFVQVWLSTQPNVDMNYWANYQGSDENKDGIGDTPYIKNDIIQDHHPLMEPIDPFKEINPTRTQTTTTNPPTINPSSTVTPTQQSTIPMETLTPSPSELNDDFGLNRASTEVIVAIITIAIVILMALILRKKQKQTE